MLSNQHLFGYNVYNTLTTPCLEDRNTMKLLPSFQNDYSINKLFSAQIKLVLFSSVIPLYFYSSLAFSATETEDFISDFETGKIQNAGDPHDGWGQQGCCADSIQVINIDKEKNHNISTRIGKNATRFIMRLSDPRDQTVNPDIPGRPRANMLRTKGTHSEFAHGKEYWVGLSVFVPNDWVTDNTRHDATFFWFQRKDACKNGAWDPTGSLEVGGSPPLEMIILGSDWILKSRWDSRPCHTHPVEGQANLWRSKIKRGQWTDFVYHIIFSAGSDGLIEVYSDNDSKDGTLTKVATKTGINTFNNELGPYFKIGLYKPGWERIINSPVDTRVIYYDEVRIADHDPALSKQENIRKVSPPGPKPPPATSSVIK